MNKKSKVKKLEIKEEYTLIQYKSSKYFFDIGSNGRMIYENGQHNLIKEKLIVGDCRYNPANILYFDSKKISKAYDDALTLDLGSEDAILKYVKKYGLPVTDGDYISQKESNNWLKDYIIVQKENMTSNPEDFCDTNSLYYTQKSIALLQAIVNLQRNLCFYYFYDEKNSDKKKAKTSKLDIVCDIFQDLICVMIALDYNCLRPAHNRHMVPTYCINADELKTRLEFSSSDELVKEILRYVDTAYVTSSSYFTYNSFQHLDFNLTPLTTEPLLKGLISYGKGITYSHGKLKLHNDQSALAVVNSSMNTEPISLLLKISETAVNICNSKKISLNDLFQHKKAEITIYDIFENYHYPAYGENRNSEICKAIYCAAELFYFEIFSDLLVDCPPTICIKKDTLIYSRKMPNLIQALFNKLYREAFLKFKKCIGCGRLFPEVSRRKNAIYCTNQCSARFRKRKSREAEKQGNK